MHAETVVVRSREAGSVFQKVHRGRTGMISTDEARGARTKLGEKEDRETSISIEGITFVA